MSPTAPRRSRSPLAAAIVAEAVRRIEADGPLDDAAALAQAFRTRPTRGEQLLERAWLLGQRLGLPAQLARGRQAGWGVLLALALLVALTGLGLARAVLGEGRHINAVAAFVSLLGLHGLTLALWLLGLLLPAARRAGAPLGRLALWLTAHLPLARGPHALTLLRSLGTAVAIGLLFGIILDGHFGSLNAALGLLKGEAVRIGWLSDPRLALIALIGVACWQYTGFHMMVLLAGIQSIPHELYEAAALDGAGCAEELLRGVERSRVDTTGEDAPAGRSGQVVGTPEPGDPVE